LTISTKYYKITKFLKTERSVFDAPYQNVQTLQFKEIVMALSFLIMPYGTKMFRLSFIKERLHRRGTDFDMYKPDPADSELAQKLIELLLTEGSEIMRLSVQPYTVTVTCESADSSDHVKKHMVAAVEQLGSELGIPVRNRTKEHFYAL
jgi:hypothetical protein